MKRLTYGEFIALHHSMNAKTRSEQIDNLMIEINMENEESKRNMIKHSDINLIVEALNDSINFNNKRIETLYQIQQNPTVTYSEYMKEIDRLLIHHLGFDSGDLEDYAWRDEYTSDVEPDEAVSEFLLNYAENW